MQLRRRRREPADAAFHAAGKFFIGQLGIAVRFRDRSFPLLFSSIRQQEPCAVNVMVVPSLKLLTSPDPHLGYSLLPGGGSWVLVSHTMWHLPLLSAFQPTVCCSPASSILSQSKAPFADIDPVPSFCSITVTSNLTDTPFCRMTSAAADDPPITKVAIAAMRRIVVTLQLDAARSGFVVLGATCSFPFSSLRWRRSVAFLRSRPSLIAAFVWFRQTRATHIYRGFVLIGAIGRGHTDAVTPAACENRFAATGVV